MSSVFVIILNFNHLDDLVETIESFQRQDYSDLNLIVVDNKSSDNSVTFIRDNFPKVHIIQNQENLGWSGGNNIGIEFALKMNAEYILLSNNDIYFDNPRIISRLVESLEKYPEFGVIGAQENEYYDRNICANQGWILYPKAKYQFNKDRLLRSEFPAKYKLIDNVSGSFMLTRASLFKKIGLIDDNFFLYGEDTDFGLRAWKEHQYSIVDTSLIIYHKGSSTIGNYSPLKMYYTTRNLIYLIRKHKKSQESHIYFLLKYYFDCVKITILIVTSKNFKNKRISNLKHQMLGIYHGVFKNKMGKLN